MPAWLYRWYFLAHGLRGLERNVLRFCGIGKIRESLIGLVESQNSKARAKWLTKMRRFGQQAM
jgi:putative NADPH-quinone reductase